MLKDRYKFRLSPTHEEELAFEQLVGVLKTQMRKDYPTGTMRRDAHAKSLGLVHGTLTIEDNLPDNLRIGVFSESREFPCWIRFSNSGGVGGVHKDDKPDVRGMAIKIVGVEGEKILPEQKDAITHDFLFATSPMFMVKNGVDFAQLTEALGSSGFSRLWKMAAFFFNPFNLRLAELRLLIKLQVKIAHVLGHQWWSMTPYRLGDNQAVKYTLIPRTPVDTTMPTDPAPDFLRERLADHLRSDAAVFDFCVQVDVGDDRTPIDDTRKEWKTSVAPFIKVATLRIPSQRLGSVEQQTYAENLSFIPWHALPEHAPLGSLNRARLVAYEAISRFRHAENNVPREEPTEVVPFEYD